MPIRSVSYLLLPAVAAALSAMAFFKILPFIIILRVAGKDPSREFISMTASSQHWVAAALLVIWIGLRFDPLKRVITLSRSKDTSSLLILVSLTAGLACLLLQWAAFENLPHITDATSHAFQAKIFSSGRLAAPNPPCFEAFFQHNVIIGKSGLWHTKYFPGQALWLTPGYLMSWPWLMMPVGWAITTWAFSFIMRRFRSFEETLVATVILGFSPLGLLAGASYMSHTTFLMFLLCGASFHVSALERPSGILQAGLMACAGFLYGMALLTRPQDILPYSIGFLVFSWSFSRSTLLSLIRTLPWIVLGALLPLAFLLFWNHTLYGRWVSTGYHFDASPSLTWIIQDSLGFNETHTPGRSLYYAGVCLFKFDQSATGWPTTLPLALLAFWPGRGSLRVGAALAVILATIGLYLFFPYIGLELEARYYLPALPATAMLAGIGLMTIAGWLCRMNRIPTGQVALYIWIAGMTYAGGHLWPTYLWPKYAKEYEQVSKEPGLIAQTALNEQGNPNGILVLMDCLGEREFFYSSGFVLNDPDLRNPVIFARHDQQHLDCLKNAFPERTLYRMSSKDMSMQRLSILETRH